MARRADFDMKVFPKRRASRELVAAAARHFDILIFGVNVRFHDVLAKTRISSRQVPEAEKRAMLTMFTPRRNRRTASALRRRNSGVA